MFKIERLEARASLDDPVAALDHARLEAAAGDQSWAEWEAQYERGHALVVRLDVSVLALGSPHEVETTLRGVFVEKDAHAPELEQQIAEMAKTNLPLVARRLREQGNDVGDIELGEMYVHVQLEPPLRNALGPG
jgi:hypothetical protein